VYYRPWTAATLILNDYIGHTLRLEFTNADCCFGGHWAYCYVDVQPGCGGPIPNKICPGTSATVTGPWGYESYNWWNSNFTQSLGTSQFLTLTPPPTVPTVYALALLPITGPACKDTVFVTVIPQPAITGNAGPDATLCGTTTNASLGTAPVAAYKYKWTPSIGLNDSNLAQPIAHPSVTTSYVLTITDTTTGCSKKDTVTVFVNALPTATISISGNVLTSSASSGNQWYLNGTAIPGATGSTYTATANGTYTVIVTANGCSSAPSNAVNYSVTGIDVIAAEWKLQLAPNPTNDKLFITYSGAQKLDLEVLDVAGRTLFVSRGIPTNYTADLSGYFKGAYMVRLTDTKTKKEVRKLILKM
jgi:hypothetical protein